MTGPDISVLIAAREQQMQDEGFATRPGTSSSVLDDDAMPTTGAGATVYSGKCTVSDPTTGQRSRTGTVVDQAGVPYARILKLPLDSPQLLPGDVWEMTASRFAPGLVGDRFVVVAEIERSYATCRKYGVRGSS
jgi:hypothetical protein